MSNQLSMIGAESQKSRTNRKGRVKIMIRELIHDPILLAIRSEPATPADKAVADDLLDTLIAHREDCVGMAANMIGIRKRIIAVSDNGNYRILFNPKILKKSGGYDTEEGCLSLLGGPRPCRRYRTLKLRWQTVDGEIRIKTFDGWTAQIIQHEIDHCDGLLI